MLAIKHYTPMRITLSSYPAGLSAPCNPNRTLTDAALYGREIHTGSLKDLDHKEIGDIS